VTVADTSFLGYRVRYTDAIYGRHLYAEKATWTLWLGKQGVMENVMANVLRNEDRATARLLYLIELSERLHKSIEWSP
jgi:hypothetical protein